MTYIHVQERAAGAGLEAALSRTKRFALDCEAAGFHRYSDRLCLLQVTVEDTTWIVDPLAFDPRELLRDPVEDPAVEVVMHGADFDLRLLRRDLQIDLRGLFDTQIAAQLLGEPGVGLAAMLESRLGLKLSKKHQRADWAGRPLTDDMLEYAANDTRHLLALADLLRADLDRTGRAAWVEEECRLLEESSAAESQEADVEVDPVTRVKGASKLPPRDLEALRVSLEWRDRLARARDRAPFRIVGDPPLLEAARTRPGSPQELRAIKGFPRALAGEEGLELLAGFRRVESAPESELRGYPRPTRRGPGRPPPEVETVLEQLKAARNARADELGLDRGALISNATLLAIALHAPTSLEALAAVDGMRRWQAEAVGPHLLRGLRGR